MTIEEIFQELANHMLEGIMFHQEMINYYDFLNLCGYKKCHEYHFFEENCGYRKLYDFYIQQYGKLIETQIAKKSDVIPRSWYRYKREDIDGQIKRQAVQNGIKLWIDWEKETKSLYQKKFQELMELNQISAAIFLQLYIQDVSKELRCAEEEFLNLKATNYDIVMIVEKQEQDYKKYKRKLGE